MSTLITFYVYVPFYWFYLQAFERKYSQYLYSDFKSVQAIQEKEKRERPVYFIVEKLTGSMTY